MITVFCPDLYDEINCADCKECKGTPGCWKQPNVECRSFISDFFTLADSCTSQPKKDPKNGCPNCGERALILRTFTAREILLAAKDANIIIIEELSLGALISEGFRQKIRSLDLSLLSCLGEEELTVSFCPHCGAIPCGFCKNPLIMDPKRDYLCIFCGGF